MAKRIVFTPGEPAGIGPDLAIQLAQFGSDDEIVAVASVELLQSRAEQLGLPLSLREVDFSKSPQGLNAGELAVLPVEINKAVTPGQLNSANGGYVLATLNAAIDACVSGRAEALVTGPLQKSVINEFQEKYTPERPFFSGHTEYLAEQTGTDKVVMMLACEGLRVALATTHLPLRDVADAINASELTQVSEILHRDLKRQFGIEKPNILVCGLNPHAGEGGHLGMEEIEIIEPVLEGLRARGMDFIGPLPADTLFQDKYLQDADAVLAMYHDQGLPVLKYKGFGEAVNVTLGLPIIRTSVDHGTALDLAGSGNASIGSLKAALSYAQRMIEARI